MPYVKNADGKWVNSTSASGKVSTETFAGFSVNGSIGAPELVRQKAAGAGAAKAPTEETFDGFGGTSGKEAMSTAQPQTIKASGLIESHPNRIVTDWGDDTASGLVGSPPHRIVTDWDDDPASAAQNAAVVAEEEFAGFGAAANGGVSKFGKTRSGLKVSVKPSQTRHGVKTVAAKPTELDDAGVPLVHDISKFSRNFSSIAVDMATTCG